MSSEIAGSPKVEFVDFLGRAATEKAAEPPKSHHRSDRPDCLPVSGLRFGSSRNCEKVVRDPSFFRFFFFPETLRGSIAFTGEHVVERGVRDAEVLPPSARKGAAAGAGAGARARGVHMRCRQTKIKIFDIFLTWFCES